MSNNMSEFDNYYKARTHAIINLKASTNYVMCVPNGMKHLSKVDYATLEQQFDEICINTSCFDNYKYSTWRYKNDQHEMVCNLLKFYEIPYKMFNLTKSAETPCIIPVAVESYDIPSGQPIKKLTAINKISNTIATIKIDYNLMNEKKILFQIKQLRGARWSKVDKTWSFDQNDTAKICKLLRDNGIQYELDGILVDETNNNSLIDNANKLSLDDEM
jgi:hypothetical protein